MSFSSEVKKELTETKYSRIESIASLSAILRSSSELVIKNGGFNIEYLTSSLDTANHIIDSYSKLFKSNSELSIRTSGNLSRKLYMVSLTLNKEILAELDFIDGLSFKETVSQVLTKKESGIKGYLKGLFIACGSVNDPSTSKYHLEIKLHDLEYAESCLNLVNSFDLNAKISQTKNKYVIYLKKAENISDFLKIIGVTKAVLYYEDVRISRDMYNNTNRLVNCDIANQRKSMEAANLQLSMIEYLEEFVGLENLTQDLQDICKLRLFYKEASLSELINHSEQILGYSLTKSGINHRFRKLKEYVNKIKEVNNSDN